MRVDVFTIFPEMIDRFAAESLLGRAQFSGVIDLHLHDLRAYTSDAHRTVDDSPFGGGPGMVLKCEPIFTAVEQERPARPLLLLGPTGRRFDQRMAEELAALEGFSMICGRYEGVDARVRRHLADLELSIGDFVLNGGEVAAMVVLETVGRLLPGMVGNEASTGEESFSTGLLEYPQYTRPAEFRGWSVPEVLLSGDHELVAAWRTAQSLHLTARLRPDLMAARGGLSEQESALMERFEAEPGGAEGLPEPS